MRFKTLAALNRAEPLYLPLAGLPREILMTRYAMKRAFAINELVRSIHGESFEWYGYTIAEKTKPELIVDLGLPENDLNRMDYTALDPLGIAAYQESLEGEKVINGWIHSHGSLDHRSFSTTDEANSITMLDYVFSFLKVPVAKREILIKDLTFLVEGGYGEADLVEGSVSIIADSPVKRARILETVHGGFCYCVVIGDDGWHTQEIVTKERGVLSGQSEVTKRGASLVLLDTGQILTADVMEALGREIREKIKPVSYDSPRLEKA